jgi:Domain of unknown function (DUF4395)
MSIFNSDQPPVDPRGPRFAAWVTVIVLVAVLVTNSAVLLAAQAVVFAIGAFAGLHLHPYGLLYRALVAPRLSPPTEREDAAPVRFAQAVGFGFAVVGALGYASGLVVVGIVATAFALGAAFLNAAFGFCLGCEIYLRLPASLRGQPAPSSIVNTSDTERGAAA